jgi:hypothetical protein
MWLVNDVSISIIVSEEFEHLWLSPIEEDIINYSSNRLLHASSEGLRSNAKYE